jgi:hypothetical protein
MYLAGKYKVVMDSDAWHVGGQGRIHWDAEHFTTPAEEGKFNERDQYFQVRVVCLFLTAAKTSALFWAA